MLAVIETHPVQYHAPVYRALQEQCGVPVTVIYGSDFSVAGYRDAEFGATFAWDTDLLAGYRSTFLSRAAPNQPIDIGNVPFTGIGAALRAVAPDAVMIVGYSPRFHRVAWYEAWRQHRPVLFRGETNDQAAGARGARRWVKRAGLRLAYTGCAAVLYIGRQSLAHFRDLGVPEDRLFFSPYCVDERTFDATETARAALREDARRALQVTDHQVVVLYSGKFSDRKGVRSIVPAIRALPEPLRSRIVVVFLGDGQLREALAADASSAPAIDARFVGFQNQRALSPFYHAADVLVLPSVRGETWGLVVNEALLHGVPCVVSDRVGCAPDLVRPGQTGHVFAAGSTEALTRALEQTWPLLGRADVRQTCRRIIGDYTISAAAQGIAEAYGAVMARGARRVS